ncbi:MAG: SDR family oxidoreductase [Gordonia polyisoprenivorans]|nr:SDR family oxidoreductase [Gordonia polyisoprenivorans]
MKALVVGGRGALGSAIVDRFVAEDWIVQTAGRSRESDVVLAADDWPQRIEGPLDAVVWAQGLNSTGSIFDAGEDAMLDAFEANVLVIARTLRRLLEVGAFAETARTVILSSIWQVTARQEKLAYVTSKAALAGLIPSLAADLADRGIAVNGVLPGVIDTPMTRSQLDPERIAAVEAATPGGRLATPDSVARTAVWLAGTSSDGVNGVSLAVDNGWSAVRHV